jgi:hypothetical protein
MPVDFDAVLREMDGSLGIAAENAVEANLAVANELRGMGTRAETQFRDSAREASCRGLL